MTTRDARELLSIDVTAEIRKLGTHQLASPIDSVSAAARMLIECGANTIEVTTKRSSTVVSGRGATISEEVQEQLACILDASRTADARHQALITWENASRLEWLAVVCTSDVDLAITTGQSTVRFEVRSARGRKLTGGDAGSTEMRVTLNDVRVRHEIVALSRILNYARIPVLIDGQNVSHGLELGDALIAVPVSGVGFTGMVGLPRDGTLARTVFVRSDVVERDLVTAANKGRIHLAVVTYRERSPDEATVARALTAVRDQLYVELKNRYPTLGSQNGAAARELLFRACEQLGDARFLDDARIVQTTRGDFVTWNTLRTMARDGVLLAVEPGQRIDNELRDVGLPILSPRERAIIARFVGLRCVTPTYRSADSTLTRWLRGGRELARASLRGAIGLLPTSRLGRELFDAELDANERALVRSLAELITSGRFRVPSATIDEPLTVVAVNRGRFPVIVRRDGRGQVLAIPVRNQRGIRMVRMVARDPGTLVIATTLLFGGQDGYGRDRNRARTVLVKNMP
ncbi:MAG: hypothetical protein H7Z43_03345 [Clostridia bacterium]|nr:hypothetical protein [Deltaproteobacteria bacterium]